MEVFVARQPILNLNQEIVAYEILYRRSTENRFPEIDGDQATSDVINSFVQIGFNEISEGKPCFVNFTENLLKLDIPKYFQPGKIVVEVLENVQFTDEVIAICQNLRNEGYKIALDDFVLPENNDPQVFKMLGVTDIIKVDIRTLSRERQRAMLKVLKKFDVELLAEKVETREEYEQCKKEGYQLFQGYFFSKPSILSTHDIPVLGKLFYNITDELSQPEPNIDKISEMIVRDLAFSYKLLKFVNTPAFNLIYEIKSIQQAIVILGLKEFKKWVYVLSIREALTDKKGIPNEIFKLCLIRAKMCESIALKKGIKAESSGYFLTGLFSLIHVLLKQPLRKIMEELPLDMNIKYALLGFDSSYKDVLDLSIAIEEASWEEINRLTNELGIEKKDLYKIYRDTMSWIRSVFAEPMTQI
jgi:c-di-GMP-related signal transduction protein